MVGEHNPEHPQLSSLLSLSLSPIVAVHAFLRTGEQKHHRAQLAGQQPRRRGGKGSGTGSGSKSNSYCHLALSMTLKRIFFVFCFGDACVGRKW